MEVAHAIARTNKSKLKRFFRRVQAKKGYNVAAVALARKVLCILHHLLMNREQYQEDDAKKIKPIIVDTSSPATKMGLDEMIQVLVKAGCNTKDFSFDTEG